MMNCTDRHCRVLLRLISPHTLLFSEMVVTGALIHGNAQNFLKHGQDGPCALQLGGSDPKQLQLCAQLAEDAGYQEVNLNIGCPSSRVQQGAIGACLMAEPELVARCVASMQSKVNIPVTVKCRIGIDDQDSYESFRHFIQTVADSGCQIFYVHARKAILKGLSPKENRDVPPLRYDYVYTIVKEIPHCDFYINGGISSVSDARQHLDKVDGIMLGRAPYQNPYMLAELEKQIYDFDSPTRFEVIASYLDYASECLAEDGHPKHVVRHLLGLFNGQPGARHFRRHLSEVMHRKETTLDIVYDALDSSGLLSRSQPGPSAQLS